MSSLEDLYREIILDHYRTPRNSGELESPPAKRAEGFNPLCGDEIVVSIDVRGDNVISDIKISGQGCSISQSSASMMSVAIKGKKVSEALAIAKSFKQMMNIHEIGLEDETEVFHAEAETQLGDLEALRGVVKFPVRIKCATLSWNTLTQAFQEDAQNLTEPNR